MIAHPLLISGRAALCVFLLLLGYAVQPSSADFEIIKTGGACWNWYSSQVSGDGTRILSEVYLNSFLGGTWRAPALYAYEPSQCASACSTGAFPYAGLYSTRIESNGLLPNGEWPYSNPSCYCAVADPIAPANINEGGNTGIYCNNTGFAPANYGVKYITAYGGAIQAPNNDGTRTILYTLTVIKYVPDRPLYTEDSSVVVAGTHDYVSRGCYRLMNQHLYNGVVDNSYGYPPFFLDTYTFRPAGAVYQNVLSVQNCAQNCKNYTYFGMYQNTCYCSSVTTVSAPMSIVPTNSSNCNSAGGLYGGITNDVTSHRNIFVSMYQYVAPATVAPTTVAPTTVTPTTVAPTTVAPTTVTPTTVTPTTVIPTTVTPTTVIPTTVIPTTVTPTTVIPTTVIPTTVVPTTVTPSTAAPSTSGPSTASPTSPVCILPTNAPTAAPTTVAPTFPVCSIATNPITTVAPTTIAPTTVAPTTVAPTTVAPTTVAPTTVAPTTAAQPTSVQATGSLVQCGFQMKCENCCHTRHGPKCYDPTEFICIE